MSEPQERDPLADVLAVESMLGLPSGFFRALLDEDDWSYVVKTHALVEASLSHMLTEVLGRTELLDIFSRMNISGRTGKVAFVRALGLIDPPFCLFVEKLSEIRNAFAHDITNAKSTLDAYVAGLSPDKFKSLVSALGDPAGSMVLGSKSVPFPDFVRENSKVSIWVNAMFTISLAYQNRELASSKNALVQRILSPSGSTYGA